jgi:hypothetical protein
MAVAVEVVRVMGRLVAVVAGAAAAMSGHWQRRICVALVEGCRSEDNTLLGLHCSARLMLLGSLRSAGIKVRPQTRWLVLRVHDAGQRWGGGSGTCCCNSNNKQQSTRRGGGRNDSGRDVDLQW